MLNKVIMMGRLTRDPELRYTSGANSKEKVSFGLAVERDFTKSDGTRDTDFFEIEAWQKTADFVSKWFKKGQSICVEGRLQRDNWTDKDNVKRTAYKIIANTCYFAGNKPPVSTQNSPAEDLPPDFDLFDSDDVPWS